MKDKIKGKMVKENRPKFNTTDEVNCECMSCDWKGNVIDTKLDNARNNVCPLCKDQVMIYED